MSRFHYTPICYNNSINCYVRSFESTRFSSIFSFSRFSHRSVTKKKEEASASSSLFLFFVCCCCSRSVEEVRNELHCLSFFSRLCFPFLSTVLVFKFSFLCVCVHRQLFGLFSRSFFFAFSLTFSGQWPLARWILCSPHWRAGFQRAPVATVRCFRPPLGGSSLPPRSSLPLPGRQAWRL